MCESAHEVVGSTLIICSCNRPELLWETVQSVLAGDTLPDELIVVDQSDVPHPTLQTLTLPTTHLRYLWTNERGLSRANNLAIAAASAPLLFFTHDDVLVERGWFGALLNALREVGPRAVVTGQVRLLDSDTEGFQATLKVETEPATYAGRIQEDVLLPLNMGLPRSSFDEVGVFDERLGPGTPFPGAEDNDLGFRLLESGYSIHYVPGALIYHRAWRQPSEFLALRWAYGVAQGAFYAKHLNLRDRHMLNRLWHDLARHAVRIPLHIRWRDRRGLSSDLLYDSALLWGLVDWLGRYTLRDTFRSLFAR